MLLAEEKPVAAGGGCRIALPQEGAERRYTCTGTDHDHILIGIRQAELVIFMYVKFEAVVLRHIQQVIGAQATSSFIIHGKGISRYRYMHLAAMGIGRR